MSFNTLASRTTLIASLAHITPRAETTIPPTIIAYTSTFGTISPWYCLNDMTYYAVPDGWARCCPRSGNCPVFTTCIDGSLIANDQFTETCNGTATQRSCVYGTIYETVGDPSPKIYPGCWPSWTEGDWAATRTIELAEVSTNTTTITSSSSSSGSSFSSGSSSSLSSSTISITSTTATTTPSNTNTRPVLPPGSIAAISVSVAFVVLCILLGIFFGHRLYQRRLAARRNNPPAPGANTGGGGPTTNPGSGGSGTNVTQTNGRTKTPVQGLVHEAGGVMVLSEAPTAPSRSAAGEGQGVGRNIGGFIFGGVVEPERDVELTSMSKDQGIDGDHRTKEQEGNGEGPSGGNHHANLSKAPVNTAGNDVSTAKNDKGLSETQNIALEGSSVPGTQKQADVLAGADEHEIYEDAQSEDNSVSSLEQNGSSRRNGKQALGL
ncbi:hypothetical protein P154DRAFT_562717 [Amniculicola lignicola CBS 123094]|uniref:Uncharacterized protein n=1 Tax=Amniculicola lignicola CBS 123094 TaxID=1392246 RepID=A0A6A5WIB1_9PLEO|nr:hypothetical protein P154DRAFT_562717 [Amniculicola lignicola CBS 123094]